MPSLYNKVIFGDQTLIDLTSDTVDVDHLLTGTTAHDKAGNVITGTCDFDTKTTDATATSDEILNTKTAYVNKVKVTGAMPNNGAITGTISTKDGEYSVAQGYHDGSGKVKIDTTEQGKIIAGNIKDGVTILGVLGTYTGEGVTAQAKTATPKKDVDQTITPDTGYDYLSQVTVNKIPVTEVANTAGGTTITIAATA